MLETLETLNDLQERFAYYKHWSPFFLKTLDTGNGICLFEFTSQDENDKWMYEHFCNFAIS